MRISKPHKPSISKILLALVCAYFFTYLGLLTVQYLVTMPIEYTFDALTCLVISGVMGPVIMLLLSIAMLEAFRRFAGV